MYRPDCSSLSDTLVFVRYTSTSSSHPKRSTCSPCQPLSSASVIDGLRKSALFHWTLFAGLSLVGLLRAQLVIKPSESLILRDQFKSFVASCTGQPNTRVGRFESLLWIECTSLVRVFSFSQPPGDLHYRSISKKMMRQGTSRIMSLLSSLALVPLFRVTVERQTYGLRLRIRNLTRNDQGIWECLGSDQEGRPLSRTLQINVKGMPFFATYNRERTV